MLDERLTLAAQLYQPCTLGADIGTDHGYLPCELLKSGVCERMILADVSPLAIRRAQAQVEKEHLQDRAQIVCADGLSAITFPCGCVSIMGMGGETMAGILMRGQDKLSGAVLVLSAHTELHLVRQAIMDIGYHITKEELCRSGGRFYVFWRAEAGAEALTDEEIRHGKLLTQSQSPLLKEYFAWRKRVLENKLTGLKCADVPDEAALAQTTQEAAYYAEKLKEESPC